MNEILICNANKQNNVLQVLFHSLTVQMLAKHMSAVGYKKQKDYLLIQFVQEKKDKSIKKCNIQVRALMIEFAKNITQKFLFNNK